MKNFVAGCEWHKLYMSATIKYKTMTRKTIKITKGVRKMLDEYSLDGETVAETVARLISETEAPTKIDESPTNIHLNEDSFKYLTECKVGTHSNTLYLLLMQNR